MEGRRLRMLTKYFPLCNNTNNAETLTFVKFRNAGMMHIKVQASCENNNNYYYYNKKV